MDRAQSQPTAPGVDHGQFLGQAATTQTPRSRWADLVAANPEHSQWYIERFRQLAASGADLVGEARLIDAMAERGATILDAGCGPGRHAGYLHRAGHTVVGIDLDPALIAAAEAEEPGPTYATGDLTTVALPAAGPQAFDLILCAGNVITFLHPATRTPVLQQFRRWLAPGGRAIIGFGLGRGYDLDDFRADTDNAGLQRTSEYSSWSLLPFTPDSSFLVTVATAD
ncbi:MAG: class I SAM-dependent methyltransferase [Propioniciclava sp.]